MAERGQETRLMAWLSIIMLLFQLIGVENTTVTDGLPTEICVGNDGLDW